MLKFLLKNAKVNFDFPLVPYDDFKVHGDYNSIQATGWTLYVFLWKSAFIHCPHQFPISLNLLAIDRQECNP